MKGNDDKCHVFLSTDETVQRNIGTAVYIIANVKSY